MRHPSVYLFAAVLAAACCGASAAAAPACVLSASAISGKIKKDGVRAMLLNLPQDSHKGFNELVDCIWGGKKEWIDIAVPVIAETHPDSEDELADAIQNALSANPEVVLSERWPAYFTVTDYICSVSVDGYDRYGDAIAELDRRVAAVKRINRPELKGKVDECLMGFEKGKKDLARFYQIDRPSNYIPPAPLPAPDSGTAPKVSGQTPRGGYATSPATLPATPAGPLALSLRDRSPTAKQSFAFAARPDPGTAPPPPIFLHAGTSHDFE